VERSGERMNSPAFFEIQADDPEHAIRFYTAVFGWQFTKVPGLPVEYWLIRTENMRGGLLKRPAPPPPPRSDTNAYVCSMEVPDFDAAAGAIVEHGGQVAMAKFAVPRTCWQGYFLDPQGNTFGVFQADANAE
jgi:predicted enzyme related to lactoylglutathione lyase